MMGAYGFQLSTETKGAGRGWVMSIFDRFISRDAAEPEREPFHPIPYKKRFAELDKSGQEAMERYPEDRKTVEDFLWALKASSRERHTKSLEGELLPIKAAARFFLSRDRLLAYACLLPPENDGDGITLEEFLGDMHFEGIRYGVLQQDIPAEFARGYLHVFPVARGRPFQEGEDGSVTELFPRRRSMRLEVQNGSEVAFGQDVQLQPIRKGTVICQIHPPRPGTDGMDVTGQVLPSPRPVSAQVSQGENTALSRDGQALVACVDGILYMENDAFSIHAQKIIDGDLDQFQGTLQISGNLYIGGNVDGGAAVEATGEIVINGRVGRARVTSSGGTIRVQQGVYGTKDQTLLTAAGQIQTPVVEMAEIDAGTSLIAETISNSSVRCGGTVYVMSGRGLITNSVILAGDSILCQRVGNLAGGRSRFSVGYPPHILESRERIREEMAKIQPTIDMLWDTVTNLRRKSSRLSEGEKLLLAQLVEQRKLYTEKQEALTLELRALHKELEKKTKGRIRCEKVYPSLEIQIGRLKEEISLEEENCNIHCEQSIILMR